MIDVDFPEILTPVFDNLSQSIYDAIVMYGGRGGAKSEALTANQAEKITSLSAQVARLEQIEKENAELKRMIENNRKVDDKQQSLLDQPEATKNTKTTK